MKINHIITEFVTPQATAQDPGLEREKDVDVIFYGQMPQDFTADTVAEALEAVLPREYPPGSSNTTNSNVYRVVTEIAKHQGAVVTTKPLSIAQKLVKTFQTYGIKCKIDGPGLEEDITRRGFLQGAGAAAVAGAAGGTATKANAQQVSQWAKYATDLATKSMGRIHQDTGYDLRNWLVVNVSNWVTDYCTKTNSYNAKEVIDYCNQQGLAASGLDKQHALVTAFLTNMKNRYQDFLSAYRAAISDKIQEFNQAVQSQKQEKSAMGELSKEEFSILTDALLLYAVSKEDNHPVHPQISAILGKFIKAKNNKDYVNSIYGKVNQSLAQIRPNAQLYADEKAKFYKTANNTLANMNKIIADAEPEFKESVDHGMAEAARPPIAPDPQNYDSDWDYYNDRDADDMTDSDPADDMTDDESDDWFDESKEKVGNMDADAFDAALSRMKKLAGAGPLRTVYDPARRVYKNVPHAVQPAQQPKKAR